MSGSGRRTQLEMEAIFADVEDHLIRVRQQARITSALVAKYQVTPTTVRRWIAEVFARYRASARPEQREERRDLMRSTLDSIMSMALNKTSIVRTPDGKPMMDPANPKRPMRQPVPDLKNALDACKQLRDLDGLDEPIKVTTDGKTTVVFGTDDRTELEKALRGLR